MKKALSILVWVAAVWYVVMLGVQFLLEQLGYEVYRSLDTNWKTIGFAFLWLCCQYSLLRFTPKHIVWPLLHTKPWQKLLTYSAYVAALGLVLGFLPNHFPSFVLIGVGLAFWWMGYILHYYLSNPFHRAALALLFISLTNATLLFWTHEESNKKWHVKYAQALAEGEDSLAVAELQQILPQIEAPMDSTQLTEAWESAWLASPYLLSKYNYEITVADTLDTLVNPRLLSLELGVPMYEIIGLGQYHIQVTLDRSFRWSTHYPNQDYKGLDNLHDYKFVVVKDGLALLSNTHDFDPIIPHVKLPPVGEHSKAELSGFDVKIYRAATDEYVLIGEPLSEVEVWLSNFSLFFFLLILVILVLEFIGVFLVFKRFGRFWASLPIEHRMQLLLLFMSVSIFLIISAATFIFLYQNNKSISSRQKQYVASTVQTTLRGTENWDEKTSLSALHRLASKKMCDVDIYNIEGDWWKGSTTLQKSPNVPAKIPTDVMKIINKTPNAIASHKLRVEGDGIFRTYFGIQKLDGHLFAIGLVSTHESQMGVANDIPIIMGKLLNVYVGLLVLLLLLAQILLSQLFRPLRLLSSRLQSFMVGQSNAKLQQWPGNDAIGQLILAYNQMVDKVEQTTQELMEAEREGAWQTMSKQVSHEINNTITPLSLQGQYLARLLGSDREVDTQSVRRVLDSLLAQVDRLRHISEQFQIISNLEKPTATVVDISQVVTEWLADKTESVVLQDSPKAGQPSTILFDEKSLLTVLDALYQKSMEQLESTAELIEIQLYVEEQDIVMEMSNNGTSMDEEELNTLFSPDFHTNMTDSGMMLPILHKLIQYYGGELSCRNKQEEDGFIFSMRFPVTTKKSR